VHDVAVGALLTVPSEGEAADAVQEALSEGLIVVRPDEMLDLTEDGRVALGLASVTADGIEVGGRD
jgi:glutamate synthase domain-containing protein 3